MTAKKILFIVLDGISDRPYPVLGGTTPLAAARTPVLDKLAAEGICGIMDTSRPASGPGSDTPTSPSSATTRTNIIPAGTAGVEGSGIQWNPG